MKRYRSVIGLLLASLLYPVWICGDRLHAEEQLVKIGAVLPLTGPFSVAGIQGNDGMKDCIAIVNEDGGINGKKIRYTVEDGQYKLDVAKAAFELIMDRDNPLAMFGESTHLGKAMAGAIRDRYKILYSSTSFASDLAQAGLYPSIFIPGPTYSDQVGILLRYISQQTPSARVALFYSDTEFGRDPIPFAHKLIPKMKLALVADLVEEIKPKDLDASVKTLVESNPDYVIVHGFVGTCLPDLIKKARAAGLKCQFAGTYWEAHKGVLDALGPLGDGLLGVNPYARWWMEHVPMIKKIREYNARHHPEVKHRPTQYMFGFASGLIFVEILRQADKAGKLNYDGMVEALKNLKDFDTGGLTAPLTCYNNSFPQARVWRANAASGQFEPITEWLTFRLKRHIE